LQKFYEIKINGTHNGIIVEVGCVKLVYQQTQLDMFYADLALYLVDREKGYKAIRERWQIYEEADQAEVAAEERPSVAKEVKAAE